MTPLDERLAQCRDPYPTAPETDIHASGRIWTRNTSKWAAADPGLRPLGHCGLNCSSRSCPQWHYLLIHNVHKTESANTAFFELSSFLHLSFKQLFNNKSLDLPTRFTDITISNLITVQQDATYSVHYISVGSSTCFGCWHPSSGARTTVITASGID